MAARRWRRSLSLAALVLAGFATIVVAAEPTDDEEPHLDAALVDEALEVIVERYVDEEALVTEDLTAGAIRGIVEALGDEGHTEYLTPVEHAAAMDALEGRVTGIGVVLDQRSEAPSVISVIDGSPADRAGLRSGDVIGSVDGDETTRLPLDELAALVRGEAGTMVELGIDRPGLLDRLEVRIVREDVEVPPADWTVVPGTNVAVVRIVQFSTAAGERTREAVTDALAEGIGGLILDLRGNPGGFVHEALDVLAAFLDGGVAYREVGRDGSPRDVPIPRGRVLAAEVPVIVLVDYATASSAEILAAGLRDNDRALLVGEQTYGTGTIINTFELSDGSALKLGVLDWLTPDGETVFRVGLAPDHDVDQAPGSARLRPDELRAMTPAEISSAEDLPLRRAVALLEPLAAR
jgi:carboxyl-terminal processing protease